MPALPSRAGRGLGRGSTEAVASGRTSQEAASPVTARAAAAAGLLLVAGAVLAEVESDRFSRLLDILNDGAVPQTGGMTDSSVQATTAGATRHQTGSGSSGLVSRYHRDGYVVLPDALSAAEVRALREEAVRICRGELGAVDGVQRAGADEPDELVVRRYLCIHFPHKLSERMRGALAHPVVVDALQQLIGPNVKAMQSMLFIKSEGRPGQAWHQDELFIPTRDRSLTAAWIALDDATVENGCLWVLPGSQRRGVRTRTGTTTTPGSTAKSRRTTSPTSTTARSPSRCPRVPSSCLTAICCTGRCRTPGVMACAARWSATT